MKRKIISINEAIIWLKHNLQKPKDKESAVYEVIGQYSAEDVFAPGNVPPGKVAGCDAFLVSPGSEKGIFHVKGSYSCIYPPPGIPGKSETIRVEKGTSIPFECLLNPVEKATLVGTDRVRLDFPAKDFITRQGDFISSGELLVKKGEKIMASTRALLNACELQHVNTVNLPEIHIITIGSELGNPGAPEISGTYLNDLLLELGFEVNLTGPLLDDDEQIRKTITRLLPGKLLLVCGGTGIGLTDRTIAALRPGGIRISAEGIKIQPGSTTTLAVGRKGVCVFLPGEPEDVYAVFEVFIKPALRSWLDINLKTWKGNPEISLAKPWKGEKETFFLLPGKIIENHLKIETDPGKGGLFRSQSRILLTPGKEIRTIGVLL